MDRKLASIQKILALDPIVGADKIEVASILGWHVVVQKGIHQVGDEVIYCEVDSLFPNTPEFMNEHFEFLVNNKMRVKIIKLRGQVSQGLVLPLSYVTSRISAKKCVEGLDVTELLGITKYEADTENKVPIAEKGFYKAVVLPFVYGVVYGTEFRKKLKAWPAFLPKTDETRLQAVPWLIDKFRNEFWIVTEKLEGQSVSYVLHDGTFTVYSRGQNKTPNKKPIYEATWWKDILIKLFKMRLIDDLGQNTFWNTAVRMGIEGKMRSLDRNITFQGEQVGPGIQGNIYGLKEVDVYIYNAYDNDKMEYLNPSEMVGICNALELKMVPVIESGFSIENQTVDSLIEMANGTSVLAKTAREGLVFRPFKEQTVPRYGRLSFKCVSPVYLLKHSKD